MALNVQLDAHLKREIGATGYSVSGAVATITGAMTHQQLGRLVDVAGAIDHHVGVAAGVLTVTPARK